MKLTLDRKAMRVRFHELRAQRDEMEAKSAPIRAKRDAFVNEYRSKLVVHNKAVHEAEKGLFEVADEMNLLVKMLNGQTALDADEPEAAAASAKP